MHAARPAFFTSAIAYIVEVDVIPVILGECASLTALRVYEYAYDGSRD